VQPVPDNTENRIETSENIEELKKALESEKARAEANLAGWQRAQADFINYKRFAEQEKTETIKFANVALLQSILPVLDDFERALSAVPPEDAQKPWVEGLKLIDRKFRDTLEKSGISPIKAVGEEFDCRLMEAITCVPGKKDIVVQELEKGYLLQDKVIRPAKVLVGSGEEQVKKEE
jgi:molecular chaperone GrpE